MFRALSWRQLSMSISPACLFIPEYVILTGPYASMRGRHSPLCSPQAIIPGPGEETIAAAGLARESLMLKHGDRGMTSESVGALNEIMRKERRSMDRWSRLDASLTNEPAGSPLLQAPYCFGAPPGMPASVEYLGRRSVADSIQHLSECASLPQLPGGLPSTSSRRLPRKPSISDTFRHRLAPATPVDHSWAVAEPKRTPPVWSSLEDQPRTWTPCGELHAWTTPGPRAWLKEKLLEAEDTGTDVLSLYVMRKHSRRFMPGSHYDLELRGKQPRRLLASMNSDGHCSQYPALAPLTRNRHPQSTIELG